MENDHLKQTAKAMVVKTILAADESSGTIKKRFATIGVESNPQINRQYRQLLFTAEGIEKYISGVILYDETIRQTTDEGIPFPTLLTKKGIIPGIKVDQGTAKFKEDGVDTYTNGLDGLAERFAEYKNLGARFSKWRTVYTIADGSPTNEAVEKNAKDLASYALVSQQASITPIVEPEVLMDGDHRLEKCKEVTINVLTAVFAELKKQGVDFKGMILKPNMITAGKNNSNQAPVETVAQETLKVLQTTVPQEVPGIAFLSGGQSPDLATQHLNAMNKLRSAQETQYPWRLTASYGRALQGEALEAWAGQRDNVKTAQQVFLSRAAKVYKASLGQL